MASAQLTASSISSLSFFPSFEGGLRPSNLKVSSFVPLRESGGISLRSSRRLVVKAATVVAPKVLLLFFTIIDFVDSFYACSS